MEVQWTSLVCWEWVFKAAFEELGEEDESFQSARRVASAVELKSVETYMRRLAQSETVSEDSNVKNGRKQRRKRPPVSFLRFERNGADACWFSGTAFNCLGDKDLLVKEMLSAGLGELIPRTSVIAWDAKEEDEIVLPSEPGELCVLKPPLGCQGNGICFIRSKQQVLNEIRRDALAAMQERGFLDSIMEMKGRIPSWVLQAYVPSFLVEDRKFHVRAYVIVHQHSAQSPVDRILFYETFECRLAADAYCPDDYLNRRSHITNGAGGSATKRVTLDEVDPTLVSPWIVKDFLHRMFENPALRKRLAESTRDDAAMYDAAGEVLSLAALDIMIDKHSRPWLLEVNAKCPACPDKGLGSELYQRHLVRLAKDLVKFATQGVQDRFVEVSINVE